MFRKTIISAVLVALAAFPFSTLTAANVDAAANVAANAAVTNAAVTNAVAANDDDDDMPRRCAVITGMNLSCPTTADRDHNAAHDERAASFANPLGNIMLEYYLPNDHFSVVGGYNAEVLQWFSGDVSATLRNIVLGARCYPLSNGCAIQPYAALVTYTNVGTQNETGYIEASSSGMGTSYSYERHYSISYPRFSVAPAIGLDCYLFSSLALEFQYGFPLALNGKTSVSTTYNGQPETYGMRSNMHRHNIQIGLKLTFPFRFTSDDGNTLYKFIATALGLYCPDDEPKKETKKEHQKARLKRVLDAY